MASRTSRRFERFKLALGLLELPFFLGNVVLESVDPVEHDLDPVFLLPGSASPGGGRESFETVWMRRRREES